MHTPYEFQFRKDMRNQAIGYSTSIHTQCLMENLACARIEAQLTILRPEIFSLACEGAA